MKPGCVLIFRCCCSLMLGVFIKCLLFLRNAGCVLAKIRALRKETQRDGQGFVWRRARTQFVGAWVRRGARAQFVGRLGQAPRESAICRTPAPNFERRIVRGSKETWGKRGKPNTW